MPEMPWIHDRANFVLIFGGRVFRPNFTWPPYLIMQLPNGIVTQELRSQNIYAQTPTS